MRTPSSLAFQLLNAGVKTVLILGDKTYEFAPQRKTQLNVQQRHAPKRRPLRGPWRVLVNAALGYERYHRR